MFCGGEYHSEGHGFVFPYFSSPLFPLSVLTLFSVASSLPYSLSSTSFPFTHATLSPSPLLNPPSLLPVFFSNRCIPPPLSSLSNTCHPLLSLFSPCYFFLSVSAKPWQFDVLLPSHACSFLQFPFFTFNFPFFDVNFNSVIITTPLLFLGRLIAPSSSHCLFPLSCSTRLPILLIILPLRTCCPCRLL